MTENETKIRQVYEDYKMVLEEAKSMGCNKIKGLYNIPLDTFETIVSALKKQIPIKLCIEGDGYADGHLVYDTWICPNCEKHYEIDYDNYEYCPNCGQHIDRSQLN